MVEDARLVRNGNTPYNGQVSKGVYTSHDLAREEGRTYLAHLDFAPMQPLPTPLTARLGSGPPIRAILFDVYGTLLISEVGDIGLSNLGEPGGKSFILESSEKAYAWEEVQGLLEALIKEEHERVKREEKHIQFPEVDIICVWTQVFHKLGLQKDLKDIVQTALHFELQSNRVDLMPQAKELLKALASRIPLGIVSNAQFYTPLLLERLLGEELSALGLREDLRQWSYLVGCGKPDPLIFQKPLEELREKGIKEQETLYLGNDMLNDIACAGELGLQTALFAGDARSLRLREEHPRVQDVKPDYIIKELGEVLTLNIVGS